MAFCMNCGKPLPDGAKFCVNCGNPVNEANSTNQRKTTYEGEIRKCPNCGEILNSFTIVCPSCGYELRGSNSANSIKEFSLNLSRIGSNSQKIDLIRAFPIPNNKEDIFEFMILAASSFDSSFYVAHQNEEDISDAWLSKIEQCYEKSKLLFENDTPSFQKIQEIYEKVKLECAEKLKEYNKLIVKERKKQRNAQRDKHLMVTLIIGVLVMILIASITIAIFSHMGAISFRRDSIKIGLLPMDIEEKNFEDIIALLNEKGFTNITIREKEWNSGDTAGAVVDISIDGKTEFYRITKFKRDSQIILSYIGYPKNIELSINIDTLIGQNYNNVVDYFKNLGFVNVQGKGEEWNPNLGQLSVTKITINGLDQIDQNAVFSQDTKIIITYNALPKSIEMDFGSKDVKGNDYESVIDLLKSKGFVYIEATEGSWNMFYKSKTIK